MAERATQVFAILIGAVFLVSGVVYLYLGRETLLWIGDLWDVYAFAWKQTWLQSALLKQDAHVRFFPSLICLANLRFFHGDVQMLFFVGLGLLFITVLLLLIPVWRDKTVSLTAKTLSTLVVLMGNFWMGRASITANGEFNCDTSLVMGGAALAFLLIAKTRCSWTVTAIVVCAGFVASFSFGAGCYFWLGACVFRGERLFYSRSALLQQPSSTRCFPQFRHCTAYKKCRRSLSAIP